MNKILKTLSVYLLITALLMMTLPVYADETEASVQEPTLLAEETPLETTGETDDTDTEPAPPFAGAGTEEEPYLISTSDDLVTLSELTNAPADDTIYEDAYYKITNDIDMTGVTNFYGIARREKQDGSTYTLDTGKPTFSGTIDGDGHIISNMTIDRSNNTGSNNIAALVCWSGGNATVKNLGLVSPTITASTRAAGFVGRGKAVIENCFIRGTASLTAGTTAAFIAAYDSGSVIRNCYSTPNGIGMASMNGSSKTIVYTNVYWKANASSMPAGSTNVLSIQAKGRYWADSNAYTTTNAPLETAQGAFLKAADGTFVADVNNVNGGYPLLKWESLRVSDSGVVVIADFAAQADGTYDFVIKNCYTGPLSAAAAVVFYGENDMLLGAKVYGDTALESGDTIEEAAVSISGVAGAVSARIFLWNTLSGQELNDCLEYKILSE